MLRKDYLLIEILRSLSELQDRVLNTLKGSDLEEYNAIRLQEAWGRVIGCVELLDDSGIVVDASNEQIDSAKTLIVMKLAEASVIGQLDKDSL